MRLSRLALSALLCLGAPATAWAQDGGVQISLTSSIGVTDNVNQTPDDSDEAREVGGTFDVSPGFAFNYLTPRTTNRLAYVFTFGLPDLREAGDYAISNALTYGSQFETSPTTSLALSLTGTHGLTRQVTGVDVPATTAFNVQPDETYFFRADVSQGFTKALSPTLEFGQGLTLGGFFPLDEPAREPVSYSIGLSFTGATSWRDDTLGLTLSSGYTLFESVDEILTDPTPVAAEPRRHALLTSLTANWRRDWTDRWATNLGLGATHTIDPSDGSGSTITPTGQASVLYTREEYQAELSNSLAAQPNVETGEIVLANTAALRIALPLYTNPHHAVTTSASSGYQYSQPLDDQGTFLDPTHVFLADAALIWSPLSLPIDYQMSLRYQFTRQLAENEAEADFSRHTVLLALTAAFDDRARETTPLITGPYRRPEPEPERPRPEPLPGE